MLGEGFPLRLVDVTQETDKVLETGCTYLCEQGAIVLEPGTGLVYSIEERHRIFFFLIRSVLLLREFAFAGGCFR